MKAQKKPHQSYIVIYIRKERRIRRNQQNLKRMCISHTIRDLEEEKDGKLMHEQLILLYIQYVYVML